MPMTEESEEFLSMQKLYHFTRFNTALKILCSGKLIFGKLRNMNDPCESLKNIYNSLFGEDKELIPRIEREIYHYEQISLCHDDKNRLGFDLHSMWANYADKGYGVCFVFEKNSMCTYLESDNLYVADEVNYNDVFSQDTNTDIRDMHEIKTWINEHVKDLFFTKRSEWQHEQEFRIIRRFTNNHKAHFLNIAPCLKYVIMFNSKTISHEANITTSFEYDLMKQFINPEVKILTYESFLGDYLLVSDERRTIWQKSGIIDNPTRLLAID